MGARDTPEWSKLSNKSGPGAIASYVTGGDSVAASENKGKLLPKANVLPRQAPLASGSGVGQIDHW